MQNIGIHTIEDCLEILTGIQKHSLTFNIKNSDSAIMSSIARQVSKGTALTDKQYSLMKTKLAEYKDQFEKNNIIDFDKALTKLRYDLRSIDRSKTISIVEDPEFYVGSVKDTYIKIKFPFSKSLIVKIENLVGKFRNAYYHKKGSHEHFFRLTENTIFAIVDQFKNLGFSIEQSLLDSYAEIEKYINQKENFIIGISNNQFINVNDRALSLISNELGSLKVEDNYLKLYDRRIRYGFQHLDIQPKDLGYASVLACREQNEIVSKPSEINNDVLVDAINYLDRFPLLVVLDENNAIQQIQEFYSKISQTIDSSRHSVLFRVEGESQFNNYIKEQNINNWLDNNIKVVYISNKKLPKLLLENEWKPMTALIFDSNTNRQVDIFVKNYCDLVIYREETLSPMRKYSHYYGHM